MKRESDLLSGHVNSSTIGLYTFSEIQTNFKTCFTINLPINLHFSFLDDTTFKDILRFIGDHQLLRVKAIVWNILPNVRKDALLTKQARLIDLFKPKEIWQNVMIICKQSRNPEDDAQGALAAARQFNPKAQPPVLGNITLSRKNINDFTRLFY